jgi:hypothetical protein
MMKSKVFAVAVILGAVVSTGAGEASWPSASRGNHYFVHRPSADSHDHLVVPGEWAGQTFQAASSDISGVWILSDLDPAAITVEILEFASGSVVGTGTSYRSVGKAIRVDFRSPLVVSAGIYYMLRITSAAPIGVSFSNYDDYPIGDGRLHDTGNCCVHGDDLNARIIG